MDLRPSSEVKAQIAKQFLVVGDWVRKFGVVEIGFWHRTAPRGARRRSLVISASRTIFQAALITQILDPRGCWHALPWPLGYAASKPCVPYRRKRSTAERVKCLCPPTVMQDG